MRTPTQLTFGALCLVLGAGLVAAQEEDPGLEDPAQMEAEAPAPAEEGDQVQMGPPGAPQGQATAPGEVHTVVKGDTLWDLSQTYLGSPWYWPKVWSYNPEIANPHWIYPGNLIRFFPTGEEVPSRVEVGEGPEELPVEAEEDLEIPSAFQDEDTGSVTAAGKIGYTPKQTSQMLLRGFVTGRELAEAGQIVGSFAEKQMLSFPDTVYIRFKDRGNVQLGQDYVVFKTVKKVEHPETGADVGYLTHFLGKVKVLKVDDGVVTARIVDTWDEIQRGDMIGPANESLRLSIAPRPNERAVAGTIVELMVPFLTLVGEHYVVLIDRGSSDGVQVGNTFTVIRQQDMGGNFLQPQKDQDDRWPEESIAACMVIDVKDRASTCLMVRSLREVYRGDRVVMKLDATPTAMR